MRLKERLASLRGTLHFSVWRGGEEVERYEQHNLIVDAGRKKLAEVIAGLSPGRIASVGVGTGAAAASVLDTKLTDQLLIPITKASIDGLTARFEFEIGKDVANGMNIKEFGLFFGDGTMFSHRVREGGNDLVKADDIIITGFWEVDF